MPTVWTDKGFWIGGAGHEHVKLRVNIDGKGEYSCKLPETVARLTGQKKVTGMGLNGVISEAKRLCKLVDTKLRELSCKNCGGTGQVAVRRLGHEYMAEDCEKCGGTGTLTP